MTHRLAITLGIALLMTQNVAVNSAENHWGPIRAEYVRNYDVDTITFNMNPYPGIWLRDTRIRVLSIDGPEIRGKCDAEKVFAKKGKARVRDLLTSADVIELLVTGLDLYGRTLAHVSIWNDGNRSDLSELLLNEKYVVYYDGKAARSKDWCG